MLFKKTGFIEGRRSINLEPFVTRPAKILNFTATDTLSNGITRKTVNAFEFF